MAKKTVRLSNKQQNEEVKGNIIELYELKDKFSKSKKEYEDRIEKLTVAIKNFMFVNGVNSLTFKAYSGERFCKEPGMLKCDMVTPCSIKFIPNKMEEKLGKEKASNYIEKEVVIESWEAFSDYMKEIGADPKEIKKFISVRKTVNKKALDNAEKLGQISLQDLKGCYDVTKHSSYLKVTEVEEAKEEDNG